MEGWHIPFIDFILCFIIKWVIFLVLLEWVYLLLLEVHMQTMLSNQG